MLKGTGQLSPSVRPDFLPPQFTGCLVGTASYESVNPANRGSGTLTLMACDQTDPIDPLAAGTAVTDYISIDIADGPYAGYHNEGLLAVGQARQSGTPGTGNLVVKQ
jgi:hypothetical protein